MAFFFDDAFQLFGQPVSWVELIGDVTGLLSVWWLTRQVLWGWPVGLVNSVAFYVLFHHVDLFANAVLQILFFALGVLGWWQWARRHESDLSTEDSLPVRCTSSAQWVAMTAGVAVCWPLTWWFLERSTDPAQPMWDSLTLALSLVATWAQTKKLLESWLIFIVIDVISVPLFFSQNLRLTAALFTVFGVLCVVGYRDWQRSMTATAAPQLQVAP